MRIGIAADHGGFDLKEQIEKTLRQAGPEVSDFGADRLDPQDDYPDFVAPLAEAVSQGRIDRGIAICGSGVGACIVANRFPNVRAALVHDFFSAHQGVEDDNMNVLCLGARVIGPELARDIIQSFLSAQFTGAERHRRRLDKVAALEDRSRRGNEADP